LSSRSGLLSAGFHVLAVEDAEGGEASGGDLDGGFDGCPDGWGDEVPCCGGLVLGWTKNEGGREGGRQGEKGWIGKDREWAGRANVQVISRPLVPS
jgi:hypothetical protein